MAAYASQSVRDDAIDAGAGEVWPRCSPICPRRPSGSSVRRWRCRSAPGSAGCVCWTGRSFRRLSCSTAGSSRSNCTTPTWTSDTPRGTGQLGSHPRRLYEHRRAAHRGQPCPARVGRGAVRGLADVPAFNPDPDPDHDHEPLPPPVADLRAHMAAADAVVFCTAEYAGGLPGTFKNLLDWTVGGGGGLGQCFLCGRTYRRGRCCPCLAG